ncbi:hypothetical protein N7475_010265 [Penicillium sp. IBT 31633x]|nr:hypothetical protein N7475_010265 [Penicillium sp. IBT 31633x]
MAGQTAVQPGEERIGDGNHLVWHGSDEPSAGTSPFLVQGEMQSVVNGLVTGTQLYSDSLTGEEYPPEDHVDMSEPTVTPRIGACLGTSFEDFFPETFDFGGSWESLITTGKIRQASQAFESSLWYSTPDATKLYANLSPSHQFIDEESQDLLRTAHPSIPQSFDQCTRDNLLINLVNLAQKQPPEYLQSLRRALPCQHIQLPRRPGKHRPDGWKEDEYRLYEWENCIPLHTAGAWEESDSGILSMESSRVFENELPFFPSVDSGPIPPPAGKADFVRWRFDLSQPNRSKIPDPQIVLDLPSEFPRIDERFLTGKYNYLFMGVVLGTSGPGVIPSLNGLAMVNTKTARTEYYNPGEYCRVEEPIFIPRGADAPEGDGWVMTMVERNRSTGPTWSCWIPGISVTPLPSSSCPSEFGGRFMGIGYPVSL